MSALPELLKGLESLNPEERAQVLKAINPFSLPEAPPQRLSDQDAQEAEQKRHM